MNNIHTAPLELLAEKGPGPFTTEPFEAGWADEALVVVYVREIYSPSAALTLQAQISADGTRWINHATPALRMSEVGGRSLALTHFGNWLRFAGEISGGTAEGGTALLLDLYLVLKG